MELPRLHKTPALILRWTSLLHLRVRRWRRLLLRFVPTERASSVRLGGATEFLGQPERGSSRAALRTPREVGVRLHSTGPIRQDSQVRGAERPRFGGASVLPHFRAYRSYRPSKPMCERFERICRAGRRRQAPRTGGFREIVRIAMEMNPSGKRKYSGSEILNSLRSGERIVYAAGNRGRHEVPTCTNGVTTGPLSPPRDSVKL